MATAACQEGTVSIRRADAGDIDWLVSQCRDFASFFDSRHNLFPDEALAREGLWAMISNHIVFIAQKAGIPVGFVAGTLAPHMFNPAIRVLYEAFWWVTEEHRGSRAGLLLLNSFVAWGREHADWIIFTLENHSPVNDSVLLRRGFTLKERSYLMEVV